MGLLRALFLLLAASSGLFGGGLLQSSGAAAAVPAFVETAASEEAALQSRTFVEAYNLLLDHYVHPLDTAAMLRAGWDQLNKEASTHDRARGARAGRLRAIA